ncbi:MAG: ABC transporter ATP-binding protein [Caldilineaceae bacterium]|nr:ABC transporter ATP-binding protein [Caldilineaceae bacterium]MDE0070780.1 ABC transporter ATP-binding protein [Caldilineaceae bacterium]
MIRVQGVFKSYGNVEALQAVSFDVDDREIVGLVGPNGAGKTTLIKVLTGYLEPDSGRVSVGGIDVVAEPRRVQAQIGYLPENTPLYPELTVQAYLKLMADLRLVPPDRQMKQIEQAAEATGLSDRLTQPIGELSKGFRQRLGLAQAILHSPRLLILDEPTIGLDPTQIVTIRDLIRRLSRNSTVLFSTHILSEVEALCDRAIILINGQLRADARIADLAESLGVLLTLDATVEGGEAALLQLPGVEDVEVETDIDGRALYRIAAGDNKDLAPAVFRLAKELDWQVRELRNDTRPLEAVFNELALPQSKSAAPNGAAANTTPQSHPAATQN